MPNISIKSTPGKLPILTNQCHRINKLKPVARNKSNKTFANMKMERYGMKELTFFEQQIQLPLQRVFTKVSNPSFKISMLIQVFTFKTHLNMEGCVSANKHLTLHRVLTFYNHDIVLQSIDFNSMHSAVQCSNSK